MENRSIGLFGAMAIGIGGMVGGGIFAVLGVVAVQARGATPLAFAIAGVIAVLTAYSYARLSVAYPSGGGTVVLIDRAFRVGLVTGTLNNLLWLAYLVTLSLYAVAFANYGATFFGTGRHSAALLHGLISAAIIAPTLLNLLNAAIVARTETAIVAIKLALLAVVGIAGASSISHEHLATSNWPALPGVVAAGMLIFVAYEGFELIANAADDVRNPEVTLPRAFLGAVVLVLVLYVLISIVTVGSLTPEVIARASDFALSEAAKPSLGEAGFRIVAASAVLATLSAINATLYGAARLSYSIARDGELPAMLEQKVWGKPMEGLLITAVLTLVAANVFDVASISTLGSAGFLLIFAAVNAANARHAPHTKSHGWISAAGAAACLAALGALIWQTARTSPMKLWILVALVALAVTVEGSYRLAKREIRLHE
jgi:amino acid transporter